MSLYTDIKFSCNLIQNQKVNLTYSGDLFKNNSDSVTIVYGFGDAWNSTTEQLMEKTENGFTAEINLLNYDKFNFCFRNSNYEWDNNNYQNYTSPISEPQVEENQLEESNTTESQVEENQPEESNTIENQVEEHFIINENIIVQILDNLFEKDISKVDNTIIQEISNNSDSEDIKTETEISQEVNSNENIEFFVDVEKTEPVSIEESIVNSIEETNLNNDIENIFNDIYKEENIIVENAVKEDVKENNKQELLSDILTEKQNNAEEISEFDMDNLIDEILSPIVHSSTFEQENTSSIENFKQNIPENVENNSDETDEQVDNSINNLINTLYENAQNAISQEKEFIENVEVAQTTEEENENINIENIEIEPEIDSEEPLMDVLNADSNVTENNEETALIEVGSKDDFLVSPRSLGKFYMFKKKVKLAFYKLFVGIPKILSRTFDEGKTNK